MQEAAAILGPQNRTQGRCAIYLQVREELLRQHDRDLDLVRSRRQIGDRKLRRVLRDIKMIQTHLQSAARPRHGRWGDGTN